MPLVWAHSEYIKLLRSLHANAVWDMPSQTVERYLKSNHSSNFQIWTTTQRRGWLAAGKNLRVDLNGAAEVEWSVDRNSSTTTTNDTGFGFHSAMLPLNTAGRGKEVVVTITPLDSDSDNLKPDSFEIRIRT